MAYELLLESFDSGSTDKWASITGSGSVVVAAEGLRGTSALKQQWVSGSDQRTSVPFTPSTHVVVGFAVRSATAGVCQILLKNGTTQVGGLYIDLANDLRYLIGSSLSGSLGINFPNSTWVNLEFGYYVANSGGVVEIRINNVQVYSLTTDTLATAATTIDRIEFITTYSPSLHYFDDLYIAYGDELKYLGRWQVDALALTGDSTPQDFTPDTGNAWERLNAATGYVSASTADDQSMFDSATVTDTILSVHGVQVTAIANTVESGPRQMAAIVSSNAVEEQGDTVDINIGDTPMWVTSTINPDTGVAWTQSQIDAMTVGFKIVT